MIPRPCSRTTWLLYAAGWQCASLAAVCARWGLDFVEGFPKRSTLLSPEPTRTNKDAVRHQFLQHCDIIDRVRGDEMPSVMRAWANRSHMLLTPVLQLRAALNQHGFSDRFQHFARERNLATRISQCIEDAVLPVYATAIVTFVFRCFALLPGDSSRRHPYTISSPFKVVRKCPGSSKKHRTNSSLRGGVQRDHTKEGIKHQLGRVRKAPNKRSRDMSTMEALMDSNVLHGGHKFQRLDASAEVLPRSSHLAEEAFRPSFGSTWEKLANIKGRESSPAWYSPSANNQNSTIGELHTLRELISLPAPPTADIARKCKDVFGFWFSRRCFDFSVSGVDGPKASRHWDGRAGQETDGKTPDTLGAAFQGRRRRRF